MGTGLFEPKALNLHTHPLPQPNKTKHLDHKYVNPKPKRLYGLGDVMIEE